MDGKRTYSIVINGITESISEVDKLLKKLDELGSRIDAMANKSVTVNSKVNVAQTTNTSTSSSNNNASLNEEVALQKEINKLKNEGVTLDAKIAATQDEVYQKVQATKDLYKEAIADQKQIAAQERLTADAYSNTMAGMKAKLADIKQVMQTVDLGDTEQFTKLTQEADKLNAKLLEIEKSYGQFGRQVGNYEIVNDGFDKFKIQVGGVVREFSSAREAAKQLKMELLSLDGGTKKAQELREAIQQIDSAVKDIGKSSAAMDMLLDSMESIVAIANVGQGIRGLFGVDDAEMQKTIKNLVALQNVLKGIENINKQINTGEGIGAWIKPFNSGVDAATKRLLVFNRALLGTSKTAKVAAAGINLFGKALKGVATIGIVLIIEQLTSKLMDLIETFKKGNKAMQDTKKVEEEMANAYAKGSATITNYVSKLKNFNGTKEQEAKLVKDLNSELGNSLGTYDSISKWYDVLTKKGTLYAQMLQLQAKAQAAFNNLVEAQQNEQNARNASTEDYNTFLNQIASFISPEWGAKLRNQARVAAIQQATAYTEAAEEALEDANKELQQFMETNKIGDYAPQLKKTSKNTKDTVKKNEEELEQLRLKLMKEGLNKTIKQLEEERRQRLSKLNSNARNYKELELEINRYYDKKIEDAVTEHVDKTKKIYKELYDSLISYQLEYLQKYDKLNETAMQNSQGKLGSDLQKNLLSQRIGSYGIQGKNQYSPSTQKSLGIVSTVDDKMVDDLKKLIELRRESEKALTEKGLKELTRDEELKESKEKLKEAEEKYTKFYIELEGERINMSDEEYEKRRANILKRKKDLDEELAIIKEAYGEESDLAKQMLADISAEEEKLAKELTKLEGKKALMSKEAYEETLRYNSQLVENERKTEEARTEILKQQAYDAKLLADEKLRVYEEERNKFNELYSSEEDRQKASFTLQKLEEENYSKSLKDLFEQRLTAIEAYWLSRNANEKQFIDRNYENQKKINQAKHDLEISAEEKHWNELVALNDKWRESERESVLADLNQRTITKEEADKQFNAIEKKYYEQGEKSSITHKNKIEAIDAQLTKDQEAALIERNEKLKGYNAEYFQETLQEFRDFQTALSNLESKQPVMNIWGIVNLKETNKNNRELLSAYESLATQLGEKRTKLNKEYKEGVIDKNVYESTLRELDSFAADLGDKMDRVKYDMSFAGGWEQLSEGINNWVQMIGQGVSQIMSSLSEITQNQYAAQIAEQEKYIEKYSELLDKQEEITKDHADKVNDIEDELKTARGDRRQQLIDNLNAEMAAQRASLAQQKKIEKEQEKAEQKKKKLEHDQAVAKKKMDLAQAFINAAMAVSMAAVNKWPIPAIPMMAMAAAASAAQIAAIQSQNIPSYGSGGVIQGRSHAQGGVKVLGGRAEVEGGEFITNKVTTSNNIELLEYVNSKRKRINLDDMLEFYGGNVKKSIVSASPRTKFADGGMIPTLRTDIDINDRLVQTMEDYANRQVVVSVVDINDRQAAVREVEVLSGLNND